MNPRELLAQKEAGEITEKEFHRRMEKQYGITIRVRSILKPGRNRRPKDGEYLSANTAAKKVGWSRGLLVRHIQNNVQAMTPEYGVIVRKRRRRKTVWFSKALLKRLFPDSIK
jgi:hypothetical protein